MSVWGTEHKCLCSGSVSLSVTPLLCLKCRSTFIPGCHCFCLAHVSSVGRKAVMLLGGIFSKTV